MSVLYAANENYAKLVWISACSLFEHNKDYKIKLYLISDDITVDSICKIKQLTTKFGGELVVVNFSDISYGLENAQIFSGSKTTYARLFLPNIVTEEKILYLDCDTLIMESLDDLWQIDMKAYYVAGVQDMVVPHIRYGIGLNHADPYLNAGILLMNVEKMKHDNLQSRFVEYITEMNGAVPCHDQGVINHVCKGLVNVLPAKYNVMTPMFSISASQMQEFYELKNYYSDKEIIDACNEPSIIHFTAGWVSRPWFKDSKHIYAKMYEQYYKKSPWRDIPLAKATANKKVVAMHILYRILPFKLYVKIAKWRREHRGVKEYGEIDK